MRWIILRPRANAAGKIGARERRRQRAHDLVYDICRKVAASGEPLVDLLAQNADIARHLTRAQLEKMCDPGAYLGLAGEMVDEVLAREGRGKR